MFGLRRDKMVQPNRADRSAVSISRESLIALSHAAEALPLRAGRIRARQAGQYSSGFKGRGMAFDEVRPYQPGDDVRSLDWRVTARTGRAHTKLFKEERERPVLLWVDLRPSMFFATQGRFKAVLASEAAALLAWSGVQHGDQVGGLIFTSGDHQESRPRRGKSAALDLIRRLSDHPAWQTPATSMGEPSLSKPLARLRHVAKPGSLIFLLSDFRGLDDPSRSHLANLAKHNDLMMVGLYDSLEAELPPAGLYRLRSGDRELDLDSADAQLRQRYHDHFAERWQALQQLSGRHGIHWLPLATHQPLLETLQSGLGVLGRRR